MRFKESNRSIERNRPNGLRCEFSMVRVENGRDGHETPESKKLKPRIFGAGVLRLGHS